MQLKTSLKLSAPLCERARQAAKKAGYSSVEEFVEHAIEKHLSNFETAESREEVVKKLKGLGYLK
jgi:predicted DNA-binding protein